MFIPDLKQGCFKQELKNRFLCLVEVDGVDTLCYIPSSCRLSNFLDMRGRKVLLVPTAANNARTQYAVFALALRNRIIPLNMTLGNRVIGESLQSRRFSYLGKRSSIQMEHMVNGYKCDVFVEDTNTIIEIKSFLAFHDDAAFPTVYSQRSISQLNKIQHLMEQGYNVCYIFVSLNSAVKQVVVNSDLSEYYSLLKQCVDRGMIIKGYSLKIANGIATIHGQIEVVL